MVDARSMPSFRVRFRRKRSAASLTRILGIYAIVALLPLGVLAFSTIRLASDAVTDEVSARLRSAASLSAAAIQREMGGLLDLVESFAGRPSLVEVLGDRSASDRDAIRFHLKDLHAARTGVGTAFLADPSGRLIDIVPPTPSIVGDDFSYRDWYRGVTGTGRPYLSEAYMSLARGRPLVVAATTLVRGSGRAEAEPLAILVAAYDVDTVDTFVDGFAASQGITLTVTDQRGVLIAGQDGLGGGLVSMADDPQVRAALDGRSGVTTHVRGEKGEVVAAYTPVSGLGWTVTASVPAKEAFAGVDRLRTTVLILAGILALAILAGLAFLMTAFRARREAEEAVRGARDEAERAREEAERASRSKSEFLSSMSHELRTPLNAILGFGQLLETEELDDAQRESVGFILQAGRHLLDLINEILDIARIETGQMAVSIEPVSLFDVAAESVTLVRPDAAGRQISVEADLDGFRHIHVMADRQRLKQVLINLLSNAVKYNRLGGGVTLAANVSEDERVRIEVSDTGPGIPEPMHALLFRPFERLGAEGGHVEGTGLGLALTKGLIEAMRGEIGVESTVGEGTTFWVELSSAPSPDASASGQEWSPSTARAMIRATILYVEDNQLNVALVRRALARRPSMTLLTASDGRSGIDAAAASTPDLILLDLQLPDMSGQDVLTALRATEATREIPVVVVTADATSAQRQRLEARGVRAYLTKPLDIRRLLEVIDDIAREREDVDATTPS
jgi:signal transduction histidine kinase/ActR/RegA family two-component response regulator